MIILTPKIYIRIFQWIEKIIQTNKSPLPSDFRETMYNLKLWCTWKEFVCNEDDSYLTMTQQRQLALPKFINHCRKLTTDIINY